MKYFVLVLLIFLFSCKIYRENTRVKFTHIASNTKKQKKINYFLVVPNGYKLNIFEAGGEVGLEYRYIYPDSSIIYISDLEISLNFENIAKNGLSAKKFEFKMRQDALKGDTLTISGKDEKGCYWKEIMIGTVEFGYKNVTENKKGIFDNVLKSIH